MVMVKTILSIATAVSVGMAAISGKVTDTSGAPLAGAEVKLEQGGQKAASGTDGSFKLEISTGIGGGNYLSGPASHPLPVAMEGGMLRMSLLSASVVEVTSFDFSGRTIATVRRALDPGVRSLALPRGASGVHLYRVTIGAAVFILKAAGVGTVFMGANAMGCRAECRAEKKATSASGPIEDILLVTKSDYLDYRTMVMNSDTSGIEIKMIPSAGTVTDADGNAYKTIKFGNQVWMAENLRTTKLSDGTPITLATTGGSWAGLTAPGYCFFKNSTDSTLNKNYGALYNWRAVDSKKLAPAGWHVPADSEWTILVNYLVDNGYNWDATKEDKTAKSLAAKTDWIDFSEEGTPGMDRAKNNRSGFSGLPGGVRYYDNGDFDYNGERGYWWTATEDADAIINAWCRRLATDMCECGSVWNRKGNGFSVRAVKD